MGCTCGKDNKKDDMSKDKSVFIVPDIVVHTQTQEEEEKSDVSEEEKVEEIEQKQDAVDQASKSSKNIKPIKEIELNKPTVTEEKSITFKLINYNTRKEIFTGRGVKLTKTFKEMLLEIAKQQSNFKENDIKNFRYYRNVEKKQENSEAQVDDLEVAGDCIQTLEELFIDKKNPEAKSNKIAVVFCVYDILDIPENLVEAYNKTTYLGKPINNAKLDSLTLAVVDKRDSRFLMLHFPHDYFHFTYFFDEQTAYCNAVDNVFVSGGQNSATGELLNFFYAIDVKKNILSPIPNLIFPRSNHSMIFIPNKYIFIVGGNDQKSVEIYDIEESEVKIDSHLNEPRSEATLFCLNSSYLYAFCGYNTSTDFIENYEVCDLKVARRVWETKSFTYASSSIKLDMRFFTAAYFLSESDVIFVGGTLINEDLSEKQYIFKNHMIDLVDKGSRNFSLENYSGEKFMLPMLSNDSEHHLSSNIVTQVSGTFTYYSLNMEEGISSIIFSEASVLDQSLVEEKAPEVNKDDIKLKFLKNGKITYAQAIVKETVEEKHNESGILADKPAANQI